MFLGISSALLTLFHFCTAQLDALSDEFINSINKAQSSWRAAKVWPEDTTHEFLRGLSGAVDPETYRSKYKHQIGYQPQFRAESKLPDNFDAREKWPKCSTIGAARNQGKCGSCWAVAVAAVFTDRFCISMNGKSNRNYSAEDILSCCGESCLAKKEPCRGGRVSSAWEFVKEKGIVSGGEYFSQQGCKPISVKTYKSASCPVCLTICTNRNFPQSYFLDKRYAIEWTFIQDADVTKIRREIMENGPVVAHMDVWYDFEAYEEGIYVNTDKSRIRDFKHAVKLIGWGFDPGLKKSYWLGVNSWGPKWGDKGTFKILSGVNHCGIESGIMTGKVDLDKRLSYYKRREGANETTSKPSNSTSPEILLTPFHFFICFFFLKLWV